jgi:hypothetical protein
VLKVDFATDTLLVSDGKHMFVCDGKSGSIKRTFSVHPSTGSHIIPRRRDEPFGVPTFAIIPDRNMFALCRSPYEPPTVHFLNGD